jgi:hydrogenase maturation factor
MTWASKKAFTVETSKIRVSEVARKVCAAFGIDPLTTMGEGALLITCRPSRVDELKKTMSKSSIPIQEIGVVGSGDGLHLVELNRRVRKFRPGRDRYWTVYEQAVARRLK